ncbi:MAG: pyridoxal-phosphate dependent enzyme, partial [Immundisolibacteraceae bacterium]|nr:pyridoxal-phosphate dependent enzyme [Immundisolibacteraceae bacterium]
MDLKSGFIDLIGNTPLVKLQQASELTGCNIYGKAEFLNPGGSIKDRTALGIVRDAEAKGHLPPGGTIVEGTAGNTGIGLALVANVLGYKTVIVMPDTQSQEKRDALRLNGADLRLVPAVPYKNPDNYIHYSQRLAEELNQSLDTGAFWANQFDNTANREVHIQTTGPEIWAQTDGQIDGFICAAGTGGTLAGVVDALKQKNPNLVAAIADPEGANLYNYY